MSAIRGILKNPAYAGAFVYGRTRTNGLPGQRRVTMLLPMPEWKVVVKDKYPAYIDWRSFERIQAILRDNHAEYSRKTSRGIPRNGTPCCKVSPGAARADTRSRCNTKAASVTFATRCTIRRTPRSASICRQDRSMSGSPPPSSMRWRRQSWRLGSRPKLPAGKPPRRLIALKRSRWSGCAIRPSWRNANSTGSIPTIAWCLRTRTPMGVGAT